ncbi:uncharacterized protein LOC124420033, partial [Lucilia cuprina]|uniref:uncharacterized protein LOC124420033 n=1 Tax=Lucilia cuprina TaxID=7375 RepID=UPI001F05B084
VIIKFTKIECKEFDKTFLAFKSCYLKVWNRNNVALNLHVRLLKTPVNNVTVNAGIYIKTSTQRYSPFMYNTTLNFCRFVKSPNRFIHWKLLYNIIRDNSNVNHSCPYNHDLIVSNFSLNSKMLLPVPLPTGDYLIKFKAGIHKDFKGEVSTYFNVKE